MSDNWHFLLQSFVFHWFKLKSSKKFPIIIICLLSVCLLVIIVNIHAQTRRRRKKRRKTIWKFTDVKENKTRSEEKERGKRRFTRLNKNEGKREREKRKKSERLLHRCLAHPSCQCLVDIGIKSMTSEHDSLMKKIFIFRCEILFSTIQIFVIKIRLN